MLKVLTLLFISSFSALSFFNSPAAPLPGAGLRILVTNDDGIDAKGLAVLAEALSKLGTVVVSAPAENCSGSSHSTDIFRGSHQAREVKVKGAIKAWAVSGTPADAVAWGVLTEGAADPFHFVVSGINAGSNVGVVAHYSGTVGAAMEGVGLGIPSIAVSQSGGQDFSLSAKVTVDLIQRLSLEKPTPGIVWAINVPNLSPGVWPKLTVAPMGGRYIKVEGFQRSEKDENGEVVFRSNLSFQKSAPAGSDTAAMQNGEVVITPLLFDWTATQEMAKMQSWDWSKPVAP